GLPQTQRRHDAIWVVVDRLTKSAHFLPIRKDYSVSRLAEIFQQEIVGERVIEGPEMIEVTNAKVAVAKEKLKEALFPITPAQYQTILPNTPCDCAPKPSWHFQLSHWSTRLHMDWLLAHLNKDFKPKSFGGKAHERYSGCPRGRNQDIKLPMDDYDQSGNDYSRIIFLYK
nr:putative disease resistance RPP13-like protein 1 [Tanacetum cinerariifolium]